MVTEYTYGWAAIVANPVLGNNGDGLSQVCDLASATFAAIQLALIDAEQAIARATAEAEAAAPAEDTSMRGVGAMVSHPATVLHRALDLLLAKADADVQAEAASKSAAEAAERAAASSSGGLDVNGHSAFATAAADAEAATADAYVESVPAAFLHFSTIFAEATQDKMVAAAATAVSESEDEMPSNFCGLEGLVMEVVGGAHAAPVLSGWWWGLDEAHSDTLCDAIVACTMAYAAANDAGAAAAAASSGGHAAGDAQDLPAIRLVRAVLAKYHELMDERGEDDSEISDDADIGEEVSAPYATAVAVAAAVAAAEGGGGGRASGRTVLWLMGCVVLLTMAVTTTPMTTTTVMTMTMTTV